MLGGGAYMLKKGSEWRKWDLHVHTPASILRSEFGNDWDKYVKVLFTQAILLDVKAIGITDYYLPEGYKILRNAYLDNPAKLSSLFSEEEIDAIKKIYIFPNIEFRLDQIIIGKQTELSWNRKLGYHILLSDKISIQDIESDFISQIRFDFASGTGGTTETRPLTKSNLEELGRRLRKEHSDFEKYSDLYVGTMCAHINLDDTVTILNRNTKFKDKFLLALPADEDLSQVNWSSQGHNLRKIQLQKAHLIFSSNPGTIKYLLSKGFEAEFGSKKGCIWGSDAHKESELFTPQLNRLTWIKADLSFDGLRQVVYDPESRVKIQETNPQKKSKYQLIDKVRFLDTRSSPEFSSEWIPLNPDLNTIIGGKSSGKSLLLQHIAKATNFTEVVEKSKICSAPLYENFEESANFDFEVIWENGDITTLKNKDSSKPITYVPQLYINSLAEKEGRNHLNLLVQDILCQEESFKNFIENESLEISEINQSISNNITTLFVIRDSLANVTREIEKIGSKTAILEELEALKLIESSLREQSGFTAQEEEEYTSLGKRLDAIKNRKNKIENLNQYGLHIVSSTQSKSKNLISNLRRQIAAELQLPKGSTFVDDMLGRLENELESSISNFTKYATSKISKIPDLVSKLSMTQTALEGEIGPYLSKVVNQAQLIETSEKIKSEEGKVQQINEKEARIKSIEEQETEVSTLIKEDYSKLLTAYGNICSELEKPKYQIADDISMAARIAFDADKFDEFTNSFDRRGNLLDLLGKIGNKDGTYTFIHGTHSENVGHIFDRLAIKSNLPTIRKGISEEEITRRLLTDCFSVNYTISYKGDEVIHMSPGKRGLVLLNLVLHLSNATHPILIDQPEDNLDNRTIYEQLNNFIRSRKDSRQIIMVTHNANLVVSSDAECIIVANQAGQNPKHENQKFRFEYCSGGLENSFIDNEASGVLNQKGIREHVCEILEGGVAAFKERELKYGLKH